MASTGEYYDADRPAAVAEPVPGAQPSGGTFSLASMRAFLWRQRLILIGVTLLVFLAGLLFTLLQTPVYTSAAIMQVETGGPELLPGQEVTDPSVPVGSYQQSVVSLLGSRNMALRVVDELGLQDNPAILEGRFDGSIDQNTEEVRRQIAASVINGATEVYAPGQTDRVVVEVEMEEPVLAARVANGFVDAFLDGTARMATGTNSYALNYLEEQIQEVRGRLIEAERQALSYARENRIVADPVAAPAALDPNSGVGTSRSSAVSVSNLAAVSGTYTQARANRIAAEAQWQATANVPASELPMVQQSNVVSSLRARQNDLEAQLSTLRERYRDDFPQIRQLSAQINEVDQQIAEAGQDIKDAIRDSYQMALRQEQALGRELERVSEETLDEQDRRVQYNIYDRDAEALRNQLAILLSRYNEIQSAANLQSGNVSVLDRAVVAGQPSSPNVLLNLIFSFVIGLAVAGGIAVLREVFDDRLRTAEGMETKLGLPALGRTPYVTEEIPGEIEDPFSPISEAYASIRATLDHAVRREHPVIQVTSSEAGEGKTTSVVALARKYAATGRKVLLVDLDLRRPGLARMFGEAKPASGIVDVLYSRVPLERALLPVGIENLDVLPMAQSPDDPVEILSSGLIAEFIERYRGQYDVMILDSAPVMGIADAPLLSRHADAVAFVVEANRAQISKARIALRRLEDMNANVVGLILTKYRALEAGESYDYEQHYYSYNSRTA